MLLLASCVSAAGPEHSLPAALPPTHTPLPAEAAPATGIASPLPTSAAAAPLPTQTPPPAATPLPDLFGQPPPASALTYILPLTVQHVSETSATLLWELSQPAPGALFYQPVGAGPESTIALPLDPAQTRHQLVLENLQPGVEYQAQIGLGEMGEALSQPGFRDSTWGPVHFRTASGQGPLRIGVFGDASFGDPATAALVERMLTYELDFAIHTGDVVAEIQNDPGPIEAYALKYYTSLSGLLHRMPVYTVPGNHDYDWPARWQDQPFYYYAFPPFTDPGLPADALSHTRQYYAFTYQDIQFLMLDTQIFFGVEGWQEQDTWMAQRLADSRFRYTIPVFHVPPFFSGAVHPEDSRPVRQYWHPLLAASNVPLAFSGHSHHYERLIADGVAYIVTGGGSSVLYAAGEIRPESQLYARRTHFVLVEIYPERIELSALDPDNVLLDRWTIHLFE